MRTILMLVFGEGCCQLALSCVWLSRMASTAHMLDRFLKIALFFLLSLGAFAQQAQAATTIVGYYQSTVIFGGGGNGITVLGNSPMDACTKQIAAFYPTLSSSPSFLTVWTGSIPSNITSGGSPDIDAKSSLGMGIN